jgi:hypothetical protein
MTERTKGTSSSSSRKPFVQDAAGVVFCLVGGFLAVSIVQLLRGQEPKESMSGLTLPVIGLVARLGSPAALVFALGLASLGIALFLRSTVLAPFRPFVSVLLGALGITLLLGAFGAGGDIGAWLPGLVTGFLGRLIDVLLGAALAWLGWTILFSATARPSRASSADVVQRIGLATRHESAAGVTPAEAALLGSDARPMARPTPRREEPARPAARPYTPGQEATPLARGARPEAFVAEAATSAFAPELGRVGPMASEDAASILTPPAPSWEAEEVLEELAEDDVEDLEGFDEEEEELEDAEFPFEDAETLAPSAILAAAAPAATARELEEKEADEEELDEAAELEELEDELADELAEEDDELEELEEREPEPGEDTLAALAEAFEVEKELEELAENEAAAEPAPAAATPTAAWEQVGLFDAEEELEPEVELTPAKPPKTDLTPSFDFGASEAKLHEHEPPAPVAESPAPAPVAAAPARPAPQAAPRPAASAAPSAEFTLQPKAPAAQPKPAPAVAHEDEVGEEERWSRLVFDAGCLILEQKRVAVSMLERRFAIDFDQACRVLDELQQSGLIGPYMGGRTRDILLTREEWLPHAPHAT